jgi:uncharacterized protein (DUF58 family)
LIQDAAVSSELYGALDWGKLVPLELRARTVADGIYAGSHRSPRRGSGVEFGGHRAYVPGDDLRWLDRHALMRHGRLLVREFETETDRALRLVLDASASMAYRSGSAPAAKLAYAALLAAALARIAIAGGDPVALDWIGGESVRSLAATGARQAFDRVIAGLEAARPGGDLRTDLPAVERALAAVARNAGRGSVVVLFSDLVDLPAGTLDRLIALASRDRVVIAVQVLDPVEAQFPFEGALRLRASEGSVRVETDGLTARSGYFEALDEIRKTWSERLVSRGGRLVPSVTHDDPVEVVRAILRAAEGGAP